MTLHMIRSGSVLGGAPFLRLLVPLCIGVTFPVEIFSAHPWQGILLMLAVFLLLILLRNLKFHYQSGWTLLLFLLILIFGMVRASLEKLEFPALQKQTYRLVLEEFAREKERSYQVTGRIIGSRAKMIAYLPKSEQVRNACPGSVLALEGQPEIIRNDGNPFEFDYRRYLNDRGIGYRIFLKEGQFHFSTPEGDPDICQRALIARKKLVDRLASSGMGGENVPLVASIAFGARDEVDKETIQAFTNTGVIHVLAVSGMNVGLLYVILDLLFHFLKSGRVGYVMHTVIMVTAIWSYALVTGMSASILRAAVMFSFVIIGTHFRREASIFNSLAVSAFILIAIHPAIVHDIGFQLSYAALASIVVLHPIIYNRLIFSNYLADKTWMMFTVTLAAQAGTLPFTLLYFHQFPAYFWFANMLVVPMVTLILYLAVLLTVLPLISSSLVAVAAQLLDWLSLAVMTTVREVGKFPHAVIRGLYPDKLEILLVLLMAVLLFTWMARRKTAYLFGFLFSGLLLAGYTGTGIYRRNMRQEAVFFNVPGKRVLALTSGRNSVVICDRTDGSEESLLRFLQPYFGARGITSAEFHILNDSTRLSGRNLGLAGGMIYFNGIEMFIQPAKDTGTNASLPKDADLVWRSGRSREDNSLVLYSKSCRLQQKSEVNSGMETTGNRSFLHFSMDRAVVLTCRSSPKAGPPDFTCNYFDEENSPGTEPGVKF